LLADAQPAAPAPQTPAANGRRVALVIGNGAYAHVTVLPNPPNDAHAIARSLRDLGFEVAVAATRSKQVPWSNSSLLGEVFLAAKP
jgi:Caspase domain